MEAYTGKERVRAAAKRSFADRVPVGIIMGHFTAYLTGCPLREFYTDARKLADCIIAGYERFRQDTVGVSIDAHRETEALGAALDFEGSSEPTITGHLLEDKKRLLTLKIPDPQADGRIPMYLEACRRIHSALPGASVGGFVSGPWNLACALRGIERIIMDTMDDPPFVHDLMAFTAAVSERVGTAIAETGVTLSTAEPTASCSVISPKIYRQFVQPYHQEVVNFFRQRKRPLSVHVCGYIDPIMNDLVDTGFVGISIDSVSSLREMVRVSGRRALVIGNVATHLFLQGSKEEIASAVKDCIDIAAPGSAYILSTGCSIPYRSDPERVAYYMDFARNYGRYETFLQPGKNP
jgi:uroporphyrinogen decarboxylase